MPPANRGIERARVSLNRGFDQFQIKIQDRFYFGRLQRVLDNDADYVTPLDMLAELRDDNKQLAAHLRETHGLCDEHRDVASASLLETWIDEAERRTWFLFETGRPGEPVGHAGGS